MPEEITSVQKLYLDLLARTNHNMMSGERIVQDLREYPQLWTSVILSPDFSGGPGILLRDLPDGYNNVDTLYIKAPPSSIYRLEELAEAWNADTFRVDRNEDFGSSEDSDVLIIMWWD